MGNFFVSGGSRWKPLRSFPVFFWGGTLRTHTKITQAHTKEKREVSNKALEDFQIVKKILKLGGFNIFLEFSPLFGEDFQFD